MRHYDIAIDSSQIGRARDGPGEDIEHDEGSLKECAGLKQGDLGNLSAEAEETVPVGFLATRSNLRFSEISYLGSGIPNQTM